MERMEGTMLSTGLAKGVSNMMGFELDRTTDLTKLDQPDWILRSDVHGECERLDDARERSKQDRSILSTLANNNPSLASAVEFTLANAAIASESASLVKERISSNLIGVEEALDSVISNMVIRLQNIESNYLCERKWMFVMSEIA